MFSVNLKASLTNYFKTMSKVKSYVTKIKILPADKSNLPVGATSLNVIHEDYKIYDSDVYTVIDYKAIQYISENFSNSDLGNILKMMNMVNGQYNLLYNKHGIHTDATLSEELEYSRNKYRDFMNRLYKKGIVYYLQGYNNGVKFKYIMLNPSLARKTKKIHVDCYNKFKHYNILNDD